ncbi:CYTH domain-containing protein [Neotamlana laminarinivorans]|uniref:CYTH domain-containing protein n=1 Tax=Neotamlana laminarinivorans TaxID=2883124 RepID=A0A9X1L0X6_9FLAO|nr:CYTH domain-containing protein [Tamlana laminarinivorans]MCB4798163.1 CYTH domain-containing protein [Tamlana laminarinivorans]
MIEIERKFLVKTEAFKTEAYKQTRLVQGYLNSHKDRAVRVRLKDDSGFLTIKGASSYSGMSRFEWEKEISKHEAEALLNICEPGIIDKIRYEVKVKNHTFEIDEFFGNNQGLVVAEVELKSESESFEKPLWLGKEVTGDAKYYNSQLIKNPFKNW